MVHFRIVHLCVPSYSRHNSKIWKFRRTRLKDASNLDTWKFHMILELLAEHLKEMWRLTINISELCLCFWGASDESILPIYKALSLRLVWYNWNTSFLISPMTGYFGCWPVWCPYEHVFSVHLSHRAYVTRGPKVPLRPFFACQRVKCFEMIVIILCIGVNLNIVLLSSSFVPWIISTCLCGKCLRRRPSGRCFKLTGLI